MKRLITRLQAPARLVALALIGLTVLGLAFLWSTSGTDPITVPEGARAGDLTLRPCQHPGEAGDLDADCGTLVVPETRAGPESRLLALPVTRIRATTEARREPIFFLTGGPGQSNMDFAWANRYTARHDVVLVGYRGIDGSVRLDCPEVESALKRSVDVLSQEFFRAYADGYRACADRLTGEGVDPASYGLVAQIDDLEAARAALGYERINLLSESAGTRTAMVYAWRYPGSIDRSVMVAVNPPGAFLWDAETTDQQIRRYADLCAADGSCRARTDDLTASLHQTPGALPDRWLLLPIKEANVRVLSMFGLFESSPRTAPASAPVVLDAWLSAAEGDASGFWAISVLSDMMLSELFVRGQYASAAMLDAQASREYFAGAPGDIANLGRAATAFGWGGGLLADAWPPAPDEEEYRRVRASEVETLLISGELDLSTPPRVATQQLLPSLPNGHEVVLPGFAHTGTFFLEQPEAGSRLVNTFFDSGRVDDSLYAPLEVDFTPAMTLGAIAKATLGALLTLAAVAVLSLLAMARRVHTRGRIGPVSGALLRSLHALVLGLGGWCLGALVVLTAMPAVRVDNALLIVVSVGVPIAVGVYWAWVHRDAPAAWKAGGLGGALAGALLGGWLGLRVSAAFLGLPTAIVGAAAGANLVLILFDIAGIGPPRGPAPPPPGGRERQAAGRSGSPRAARTASSLWFASTPPSRQGHSAP